jgi:hypothetical protein
MFEQLYDSLKKGELILLDGGFCRFHLRRDGQLTIHEIISTKPGVGQAILALLQARGAARIVAKCPQDLESNAWYERRGFRKVKEETTPSGRILNVWEL